MGNDPSVFKIDAAAMSKSRETGYLVILFADISRSTQMYEVLGDTAAQMLVNKCLSLLSEVAEEHQGTVVKTIGDEIMCTFPTSSQALEAAKGMQQVMEQIPREDHPGLPPPSIRMGFHAGPIVLEDDDVFGDAVNVAARMVQLSKPRQILTTEHTVQEFTPADKAMVRCIDRTTVKGKSQEVDIYEVVWEQMDVTVMLHSPLPVQAQQCGLSLHWGDEVIQLGPDQPAVTIGRHKDCDVVVDEVLASRLHCRIEYRRGKSILIDQSTNGTFVQVEGEEGIVLHRDEMVLNGNGILAFGREAESDSGQTVRFTCQ
jgi:class 3 adenylate cyclase